MKAFFSAIDMEEVLAVGCPNTTTRGPLVDVDAPCDSEADAVESSTTRALAQRVRLGAHAPSSDASMPCHSSSSSWCDWLDTLRSARFRFLPADDDDDSGPKD